MSGEVRRIPDVGRIRFPSIEIALGGGQRPPAIVAAEDVGVLPLEHVARDGAEHRLLNLAFARPDVAQVHRLAVGPLAQRLGRQIGRHPPGERIGDDERRRGEIVGAHLRLDAAFEIAVARQHRGDDEVPVADHLRHLVGQRSAVADAGRAAVADKVEPELLEIGEQAALGQILGHDLRSRGEAGLHPGTPGQAAFHRLLGQQTGANHDARIRGVGAARDGGDDDGAMIELAGDGRRRLRHRHRDASAGRRLRRLPRLGEHLVQRALELALGVLQGNAILRPPRAGEARLDAGQIELDHLGVERVRLLRSSIEPLNARVLLDRDDVPFVAARQPEVVERHVVDREDRHRGAVLRAHVANRRPVGDGQIVETGAEELDELADDAALAEDLGDRQHEVGRGRAFRQLAFELEAEHLGDEHRDRLPEHRRFSFDAADAPARPRRAR